METTTALEINKHTGKVLDAVIRQGKLTVLRYRKAVAELLRDYDETRVGELPIIPVNSTQIWRELPEMLAACAAGNAVYVIMRHRRAVAYLMPLSTGGI